MSASNVSVMEIEMDYSQFQHLFQTSSAGLAPDGAPHPVTLTLTDAAVFPLSEVMDLSVSAGEPCPALSGEKTPAGFGEVSGFLLDVAKGCPSGPRGNASAQSHNGSGSAARVCLEKRFNATLADASNRAHIRSLSKHQLPAAASGSRGSAGSPRPAVAGEAPPDCPGGRSQNSGCRKERHNLMERERRKRIRFYCDELNTLVPFCHAKSDKVSTLHWTTAFLRHIHRTHGDAVREEFEKTASQGKELTPECWSSLLHKEISAAEQQIPHCLTP